MQEQNLGKRKEIQFKNCSKAGTATTNRGASRNLGKEFRKKEKKSSSNIVAKLVKNQHTQAKRRLSRAKGEK